MIWFRKHIPNIIFCVCLIWIILKWWTFGSNMWALSLLIFLYALGFSLKNRTYNEYIINIINYWTNSRANR